MRRLSDHASRITPTNLDERLSASDAPTEIAPLVEAFNASLDRLEEAWKSQRAFSANAAHELRTPLAALRAHVESLLPPQAHAEATAEFDRLSRIISQLLLMSEGDHGVIRRAAGFDLAAVVTERTAEYAPAFLRSGRRIGLDTAGAPLPRMGDPVLVGIAVRNLLDNALKHTPAGASISVEIDGEGVVTVADDGPGLAADFADRAFEPFARADPNSAGAGLGLSIVARVARLHGGEAWIVPVSPGACFKFHIPVRNADTIPRAVD
jgi:signal transduction histidine kinase